MGIVPLFLGYFVGMCPLPHEQVHTHTLTPSLHPRPPPHPPPATLSYWTPTKTQIHGHADIVTVIKRLPSRVNLTVGKRQSALQRGTTMQTVRVWAARLMGEVEKPLPLWIFFFLLPISHGRGMTRAAVWPWERAAEEAGSRVGLPREHPVYKGGPR